MNFLGIGPLELFFIFILALIIFGPNDLIKAGKTLGAFMRKVVTSDGWKTFQQAQKGMRDLPTTLMREAGLEEQDLKHMTGMTDLHEATKDFEHQISPWTTPPAKTPHKPEISEGFTPSETIPSPEMEPAKPTEPPPGSPFSETIDQE
ncbi:MAG TPA: hypothetical protein DEH22_04670 [Chloroflexi bacterium]|nr:hypothetical protein [Chloroflexota bacterium]